MTEKPEDYIAKRMFLQFIHFGNINHSVHHRLAEDFSNRVLPFELTDELLADAKEISDRIFFQIYIYITYQGEDYRYIEKTYLFPFNQTYKSEQDNEIKFEKDLIKSRYFPNEDAFN